MKLNQNQLVKLSMLLSLVITGSSSLHSTLLQVRKSAEQIQTDKDRMVSSINSLLGDSINKDNLELIEAIKKYSSDIGSCSNDKLGSLIYNPKENILSNLKADKKSSTSALNCYTEKLSSCKNKLTSCISANCSTEKLSSCTSALNCCPGKLSSCKNKLTSCISANCYTEKLSSCKNKLTSCISANCSTEKLSSCTSALNCCPGKLSCDRELIDLFISNLKSKIETLEKSDALKKATSDLKAKEAANNTLTQNIDSMKSQLEEELKAKEAANNTLTQNIDSMKSQLEVVGEENIALTLCIKRLKYSGVGCFLVLLSLAIACYVYNTELFSNSKKNLLENNSKLKITYTNK